jgi:ureidoacrylate peracid hydrolase
MAHDAPFLEQGPSARDTWRVNPAHADLTRPTVPARPVELDARPKSVTVDLARSALIVVDMQNDFCHPKGWLASEISVDIAPCRAPIEPLRALLPRVRAAGVPVVFLNWGARPDRANLSPALLHVYRDRVDGRGIGDPLREGGAPVLTAGSWAAAVVDELKPEPGDIHVDKHRMSGFWDTPLDAILRHLRVTTLFFAGVNADQCVLHTLADANFLGYDTLMLEDCTATSSPNFCWEATLYNVRQIFGFTLPPGALARALP